LRGAAKSIERSKPILLVEAIKVDQNQLRVDLEGFGYLVYKMGQNYLAVHASDKAATHVMTRKA